MVRHGGLVSLAGIGVSCRAFHLMNPRIITYDIDDD